MQRVGRVLKNSAEILGKEYFCSGNHIVIPNFCFLSYLETSNFGYLLIFLFCLAVQIFREIGQHLY